MMADFEDVTARPKFRRLIRPAVRDAVVRALQVRARVVAPATEFPRCRDAGDNVVVATAVAASPCYLVTADRDLYDDADLVAALQDVGVRVVRPG
jgi:putative PIN family toxin of toxin-antitoxin system